MHIILETERLVLRRFTEDDLENLVELDNDPEVMRYLNGGEPVARELIRDVALPRLLAYYERPDGFGFWAAEEKLTGEFIGWFHFRPGKNAPPGELELGYRLRKAAWGKGYGTEGSRALIDRGFTEQGVERVTAGTLAANTGSRRVMEKSGLRHVRTYFDDWPEGIVRSPEGLVEYALTRAEWEAGRSGLAR
ncbi:GNAT family N-acetyltransferase [Nonomuraea africana]|uniref:GNAT family N-acetyltransferase n=1 Tax=Nonomuraea africana TaxID=46171 RepID=UPI0033E13E08